MFKVMGRKKKPFIDKKKAQTYRLVPRSQQDPLAENVDEAQYVLKALQESDHTHPLPLSEERRLREQHKYGIYYDDEYDYLQHLREPGTAVLEAVSDHGQPSSELGGAEKKPGLPEELFGSEVAVEGHLDKILPVTGPQPDWDPDIVAALEDAEMNTDECGGDLDDDFVLLANAGEPGLPVYVTEERRGKGQSSNAPWWKGRVDFDTSPGAAQGGQSGSDERSQSDARSDLAGGSADDVTERKSVRFTEYSLSSSVVPRSEALTLLDDRFEEFMAKYEDSELGAGEDECGGGGSEAGGGVNEFENHLLQSAVENFEKHFRHQVHNVDELQGSAPPPLTSLKQEASSPESSDSEGVSGDGVESDGSDSEEERVVAMDTTEKPKERWDCESILSTYSNLYNHPTTIVEPKPVTQVRREGIKLSSKTNLPLGVIPGSLPKQRQPKQGPITRPRNEDKGEKKARKRALKEERKQRRADKKATKLAFKSESVKLERQLAGRIQMAPVI